MEEYSYFKARGYSLQAVLEVEEAKGELSMLFDKLCARYKARTFLVEKDKGTGRYTISRFIFDNPQNVPDGWTSVPYSIGCAIGDPRPGSKDDLYIQGIAGLAERWIERQSLEDVLKTGEMPRRYVAAGSYSDCFVRETMLVQSGKKEGTLKEKETFFRGSSSAGEISDPLKHLQVLNDWYIRVPNNAEGQPCFVPPDAEKRTLMEMLRLDARECLKRNPRMVPPAYL